jgi:hypothetical protein
LFEKSQSLKKTLEILTKQNQSNNTRQEELKKALNQARSEFAKENQFEANVTNLQQQVEQIKEEIKQIRSNK